MEAIATFSGKHEHFDEILNTYVPTNAEGRTLPKQHKPMASTVGEKVAFFMQSWIKAQDVEFQLDLTNQKAVADLHIGDSVVTDVPVTYLMQIEKSMVALRGVVEKIPTLIPGTTWKEDVDRGAGIFKAESETKLTTNKIIDFKTIPVGDKFPHEVKEVTKDEVVGTWTSNRWSGRISTSFKSVLIERIDTFIANIKTAKAKANDIEHETRTIGETVFAYVFEDLAMTKAETLYT